MRKLHIASAIVALAAAICLTPSMARAQVNVDVRILPPGWVEPAPPRDFDREFLRKGFHDGIKAARWDIDRHKRFEMGDHHEYVRPPVPPMFYDDYRRGFERAYHMVLSQLIAPPPPPQMRGDLWRSTRIESYNNVMRRGYQDGQSKAYDDLSHQRNYDFNRHDIFRRPPTPDFQRDDYRLGFQRGYDDAFNHATHDDHARRDDRDHRDDRWAPEDPRDLHDAGRNGFRAGIDAARQDWFEHRDANTGRHEEFRHPPYRGPEAEEYRIGYQRGYDRTFDHLRNH